MNQLMKIIQFAFNNFGPLIVFYGVNHFYGLRTAIISSIVFSVVEVVYLFIKKIPFTGFLRFSVLITLIFGTFDLLLKTPIFFQHEATITNLIVGIYFGMTIWSSKSMIQEFVEKKNGKPITDLNALLRLRILTIVWAIYFIAKAGWCFYLSEHYSIEEALLIRSTAGTISFYALLAASIFLGRKILLFFQRRGFLPLYPEKTAS